MLPSYVFTIVSSAERGQMNELVSLTSSCVFSLTLSVERALMSELV
jgi:hypothetical protein